MDVLAQFVNVFFNDPGDKKLQLERSWPGASASRFGIPGWTNTSGDFQPGSLEFEAGHLAVILGQTYDAWQNYFGTPYDWQPGTILTVVPRAGQPLNAFYDRQGLKFFYGPDRGKSQTVYSCESCDVAAHECGHAVLDAHHPDYWDSLHPETGAFHEAFGDISALLTTLQFPSVRAQMLKETRGNLRKSNGISRLAEQVGHALYSRNGVVSSGPNTLRDLVNTYHYKETWKLPARAPATKLSSESHNFSRIFSGAFYEILTGIYDKVRAASPNLPLDDALQLARDEAGKLLASALLLAPPGDAIFQVIATAMFKADQQRGGKYFPLLRKVFSGRRIVRAKDAETFGPHTRTERRKTKSIKSLNLAADEVKPDQPPPEVVNKALHLRGEELMFARVLGERQGARAVQYRSSRNVTLKGKKYGPADGAVVPLQEGLVLNVDVAGIVEASHWYRSSGDDEKAVRNHVQKLAERGRIYDSQPGDQVDTNHLITRQQPYYIDYDQQGNKVVRRAFIACDCRR